LKNKFYNIEDRKKARIIAFQALFNYDLSSTDKDTILKLDWIDPHTDQEVIEYARFLVNGAFINLESIDSVIISKLKNWRFDRISAIDRSILRFSIFSILHEDDLPTKIVINEAIEIAKQYGTDDSYKFINGILDAIKEIRESTNG